VAPGTARRGSEASECRWSWRPWSSLGLSLVLLVISKTQRLRDSKTRFFMKVSEKERKEKKKESKHPE
jgi:hypothetical protein